MSKKHYEESELKPKLKKTNIYVGYQYQNPVKVLICFEMADHERAVKMMNKDSITFTRLVNDALKKHLETNKF